jgi:hypothetical protein
MTEQSEVARLLQQIALEYEGVKRGMDGLASVARHDFIHRKYEMIGQQTDQLGSLVGEGEALQLVCTLLASLDIEGQGGSAR